MTEYCSSSAEIKIQSNEDDATISSLKAPHLNGYSALNTSENLNGTPYAPTSLNTNGTIRIQICQNGKPSFPDNSQASK